MSNQSPKNVKHRHLLLDPTIKRWYDNLARGSEITADVYLRRLGSFCEQNQLTPATLISHPKTDRPNRDITHGTSSAARFSERACSWADVSAEPQHVCDDLSCCSFSLLFY